MEKPVNKQNPERDRDLLASVLDPEQRSQPRQVMAEEAAKDTPATDKDEMFVRTYGAIRLGVIWA